MNSIPIFLFFVRAIRVIRGQFDLSWPGMLKRHHLLLVVVALVSIASAVNGAETRKLNVLFIISDDLRAEPECFGGKAKTPNIDALAAAGVRFDRAYCQYPLCNPSRSSMLTGRYPVTTGVLGNRTRFREAHPDWITLPQYFKDNGYVVGRAGKIFHGGLDDAISWSEGADRAGGADTEEEALPPTTSPTQRPLSKSEYSDRMVVLEGDGEAHGDWKTAERTIAFLQKHKDELFFAACGFVKPHSPPSAPQRFYDLYPLDQIELPPDFQPRPTVPPGFPRGAIRRNNADLFIGRDATPQAAKEMTRAYLASASWMDMLAGRVIAELDRLGLRDRTIIVFWGDHGYQLGEKGKWSKAGSLWEQGARVPMIIAAPGRTGTCERIVQALDFYPTLVELCGLPKRDDLEGLSLVPLLNDPKAGWDHPAFTIWSEDGRTITGAAIRDEKYRYAEFDGGRGGAMLLDEANDPHELKNLSDDPQYAAVRADLSAKLNGYVSRYKPTR
jgi:arylsulfatase A-like enzyme